MAEIKKWTIIFENGYCGCEIEEEFEGTYEKAVAWANEYLPDYAEQYTHIAFGWDEDYLEEEYHAYLADCGYTIKEREEEDDE